jgi:hypothetical protein
MGERFLLYIDILGFTEMTRKEPGKVARIYSILDQLNVHKHHAFKTIVFSDTVLVYNPVIPGSRQDSEYFVWYLIEFSEGLHHRLTGQDVFFRAVISIIEGESVTASQMNGWNELESFPHGSCNITSNFLDRFLEEHGFTVSVISCQGDSDEMPAVKSHVWLEVNGFYIDLTGYQFPDCNDEVIFVSSKRPSWLKKYYQSCKKRGWTRSEKVDLCSGFGSRSELYRYVAARVA